jgi:hypothetical protein
LGSTAFRRPPRGVTCVGCANRVADAAQNNQALKAV